MGPAAGTVGRRAGRMGVRPARSGPDAPPASVHSATAVAAAQRSAQVSSLPFAHEAGTCSPRNASASARV